MAVVHPLPAVLPGPTRPLTAATPESPLCLLADP